MIKTTVLALAMALLATTPAFAVESSLQIELSTTGDFERRTAAYDCGTDTPVVVTYLNAAPNFLAIVPIEEEPAPLLFVSTIGASGVRYVAGQWLWWSDGLDASLYDATAGEDAPAILTCSEIINTP